MNDIHHKLLLYHNYFPRYFRKAEGYDPDGFFTTVDLSEKGTNGPWKIRQTPSLAVSHWYTPTPLTISQK